MSKTYEDGLNEAFEISGKLLSYPVHIQLGLFPDAYCVMDIFDKYLPQEIIKKIEDYETEKVKPISGDVALFKYENYKSLCIFLAEDDKYFWVFVPGDIIPQKISKNIPWEITKTGENFDIKGMLDKLQRNSSRMENSI